MSDEAKNPEVITLIATERGFAANRLIEPGEKFQFAKKDRNGKDRKIPSWARLPDQPAPSKKAAWNGDLRPVDAQAAAKHKGGELKKAV